MNSRCASSKKNTSFGLSRSPTSGRKVNRSASTHIKNVENITGRAAWLPTSSRRDDAAALRIDAHQIVRVEFGLAEERVGAFGLEVDQRPQDHARRRRRHCAERFELGLALVAGQERDDRAQVLQVEQRQALLVGPVKDQPECRLLGSVEPQHL